GGRGPDKERWWMMAGCRWSATRGMMLLVGLFAMVMLVSAARLGQPPEDETDGGWIPADIIGEGRARVVLASRSHRGPETELNGILDDFHDAASKADFDRYFKHWS